MAAKKPEAQATEPARDVVTVEVGGVSVDVDRAYVGSWPGVRQMARMQAADKGDGERLMAVVEFYERAVPNLDDVTEALGEDASASDVLQLLSDAVREATPKN